LLFNKLEDKTSRKSVVVHKYQHLTLNAEYRCHMMLGTIERVFKVEKLLLSHALVLYRMCSSQEANANLSAWLSSKGRGLLSLDNNETSQIRIAMQKWKTTCIGQSLSAAVYKDTH